MQLLTAVTTSLQFFGSPQLSKVFHKTQTFLKVQIVLRGPDLETSTLAMAIGVSQQTISNIENTEIVENDKLQEIAKAPGVSVEAIKNFSEEAAINYFSSFYDQSARQRQFRPTYNFNPIEKIVELYERLVQAEKDKVAYLEKLLNK